MFLSIVLVPQAVVTTRLTDYERHGTFTYRKVLFEEARAYASHFLWTIVFIRYEKEVTGFDWIGLS